MSSARHLPQIDARQQGEAIREGFEKLINENAFVVVEGTGHTGGWVGVLSVARLFPLENSFGTAPRRKVLLRVDTARTHTKDETVRFTPTPVLSAGRLCLCGGAGVGSVVGMNNADVARLLGLDVLLVGNGGLGSTYDVMVLNRNMCQAKGVGLRAVLINKVVCCAFR